MATTTTSRDAQIKSITAQAQQIQGAITKLASAEKAGMKVSSGTSVQDAERYLGQPVTKNFLQAPEEPIKPQVAPQTKIEEPQAPTAPETNKYTVQPGDTLGGIAQTQGVQAGDITGFKSGDPNKIFPGEQLDLGASYRKGVGMVSGIPASQDMGAGMAGVGQVMQTLQQPEESTQAWQNAYQIDPNIDNIFTGLDEWFSPESQRTSLVEEYQKLSKNLGIEQMNMELIDAKRVIDGTEDDIRSEITASGGLATESLVVALGNARNKTLIKNYNYLIDARNAAQTQLSTMMELTIKDREAASAEFDRKLNFAFKVAEFKERATDNAKSGLRWAIENGGGSEILKSSYDTQLAEKTLGLPTGSLAGIVAKQNKAETQTVAYGEGQALIDSNTGRVIAVYPGKVTPGTPPMTPQAKSELTSNINTINTLLNDTNLSKITGMQAYNPINRIPGSPVNYTRTQFNQLKATIALDARQKLKGSGTISDFEFRVLGEAATALDKNLSVEDTKRQLKKIRAAFVMADGGVVNIKVIDPSTGISKTGSVNRDDAEDAINQGYLIEYQ